MTAYEAAALIVAFAYALPVLQDRILRPIGQSVRRAVRSRKVQPEATGGSMLKENQRLIRETLDLRAEIKRLEEQIKPRGGGVC